MAPWHSTFYIGTDITYPGEDFAPLSEWLDYKDVPVSPEWEFFPFSANFDKGDGGRIGVGFPRATWRWAHREDVHLEALRAICPGLSALVYIRTPTNEISSGARVWRTYQCQMLWMPESIEFAVNQAIDFTLEFRRMVIQEEAE